MINWLCGGAQLSLEGDLSRVRSDIDSIRGVSREETKVLHRNTLVPKLDFAVLPLESWTVEPILRRILPRVGLAHNVVHMLIAKHGELQFWAYDNFSPGCVGVGPDVPEDLLRALVQDSVLDGYEPAD